MTDLMLSDIRERGVKDVDQAFGLSNCMGDSVISSREMEHRGETALEGWDGGVRRSGFSDGKLKLRCLLLVQLEEFSKRLDIRAWGSGEIGPKLYI